MCKKMTFEEIYAMHGRMNADRKLIDEPVLKVIELEGVEFNIHVWKEEQGNIPIFNHVVLCKCGFVIEYKTNIMATGSIIGMTTKCVRHIINKHR